jgi:hypothetical protein
MGMKRLYQLLQLVKNIVHIESETKEVDAAMAVALNLQGSQVRTALEKPGARYDDNDTQGVAFRWL